MATLNEQQTFIVEQLTQFADSITARPDNIDPASVPTKEFLLGGYAGTGKTTLIPTIAKIMQDRLSTIGSTGKVRLVTPTNKAAKRLYSKLPKPWVPRTIHSVLGATPKLWMSDNIPDLQKRMVEVQDEIDRCDSSKKLRSLELILDNISAILPMLHTIKHKEDQILELGDSPANKAKVRSLNKSIEQLQHKMMSFPISSASCLTPDDIVIGDEFSMVERDLKDKLVDRHPLALIMIGDPGQLDPVKGERWFMPPPQSTLTQVMRQGEGSGVLELATHLRQQPAVDVYGLARQFKDHEDVEFIFNRQSPLTNEGWHRLVKEYGDRWLTWRNGYSTIAHPFHTKNLNGYYRSLLGFTTTYPQPGDRLYVDGTMKNGCTYTKSHPLHLSKGDEVIVQAAGSLNVDIIDQLTLNGCDGTKEGFKISLLTESERVAFKREFENETTTPKCICDYVRKKWETEGKPTNHRAMYCTGAGEKSYVMTVDEKAANPWYDLAIRTEAIHAFCTTVPISDRFTPVSFSTLLDPSALLWDDAQRTRLWKLDNIYNKLCKGDIVKSKSPLKSLLTTRYAYCLSVHQSQGSEWDSVCVFYDPMMGRNPMTAVRWLYTAITRAKKRVCIVVI